MDGTNRSDPERTQGTRRQARNKADFCILGWTGPGFGPVTDNNLTGGQPGTSHGGMFQDEPIAPGKPVATRIFLKVVPGSRRDQIVGGLGDRLKVKVSAPPEDGRAN